MSLKLSIFSCVYWILAVNIFFYFSNRQLLTFIYGRSSFGISFLHVCFACGCMCVTTVIPKYILLLSSAVIKYSLQMHFNDRRILGIILIENNRIGS
jgi:hypothetical protein